MSDGRADHGGDGPVSHYREYPPPRRLSRHLVCTWAQRVSEGSRTYSQRVLPDGCVDLIWIGGTPPIIVGPTTHSVITPLPPGTTILGARLRPGWVPPLLGVPASELLHREVALTELWGRAAELLSEQLAECPTLQARLAALEQALGARWAEGSTADLRVSAAVAWLARHPSEHVHRLAGALGVSSRQLQRRFLSAVGYGPKTFHRIVRFQQLLSLGMQPSARRAGLGELALAAGYADQAHMSREVRELADRTPSALLGRTESTLGMSELFKTTLE